MKISIAMATYNGAQYIQEQLQSFVAQTRQPDELIITDDCSTDQTEAFVREFAKTAPFTVEFHRNEKNLGYCGNFNAALMKTTGDLVFLSDQDDVWLPEKIEYMTRAAEHNQEALVLMNDALISDAELNVSLHTKYQRIRKAGLSNESFVMGCCCAFRRDFLTWALPIPITYPGHDNWLVGLADKIQAKIIIDKPLQFYRRHGKNTSKIALNDHTLSPLSFFVSAVIRRAKEIYSQSSSFEQELHGSLENSLSLIDALERSEKFFGSLRQEARNNAIKKLEVRSEHIRRRIQIVRISRKERLAHVVRYYVFGGYREDQGIRSALKDLFVKV
ncbi:glycosyltransferase family 2 protein [Marinobacter sp. MDS2]|uniref:glycosyltransferase family 2 protein n=1 Tax=Marinobacter sp. MDS2 TaxID=3065961 RepID=UPI00273C1988|nr:glycosyltransferase family 2 protein [Marinobacter sp. MDS2]MDP4546875.1 glycosyltransferase family 2 protein [Marinobacter sp. MDS2]